MPYCSRCGVEVDKYIKYCPLCNLKIEQLDKIPNIPGNFPGDEMISKDYYIPFEKKKKIIWSVFSFLLAWGLTAAVYYLFKRIYFLLLSFFIMITIYLFLLFRVIQYLDLFFALVLPINAVTFINIVLVVFLCKKAKTKGYNIIGFILTGTILSCVAIDIIITFFITSKTIMTWSIVVVSFLIPVIVFFFYIHYILKRTPDVKKIFHI